MTTQPPQQPPRDPWADVGYNDGFGQPAPRSIRRMQAPDLLAALNDEEESAAFGDLGQFGVSSVELPAVYPNAAWERQRWAAEQKARVKAAQKIDLLYQRRVISGPAYDLLQMEFSEGHVPVIEWHGGAGWYRVWSAAEERWYSLDGWERHAQDWLPIDDPSRETAVITLQPPAQPQRPWPPQFDSGFRATPPPQMRATPPLGQGGMGAPTPHTRPLPPEWRRESPRKPWEE